MLEKDLAFVGSALADLRAFPDYARQDTGYALHLLQIGAWPPNCKPLSTVGAGVHEIVVSDDGRAFRTIFIAKFEEAIYVLHAFEKKTQKTPLADINLARRRLKEAMADRAVPA